MPRLFPPEKLSKYPHMFPVDIAVWERFLDRYGREFIAFEYDVKVGAGAEGSSLLSPEIQRDAYELTRKRIDVVGHRSGATWIIEVKDLAGVSAPGQALAYSKLYAIDFAGMPGITPVLVYATGSPDVVTVAAAMGVLAIVV